MRMSTLLVAAICCWVLLNYWIYPLSVSRWKAVSLKKKMAQAGTIVVVEKLRDLSAIAMVTSLVLWLLVTIVDFGAETSHEVSKGVIEAISSTYTVAKTWSEGYGTVVSSIALIGAIAALILTAKSARDRVAGVWIKKANEVRNRLQDNPDEIRQALDDPALRPIAERIAEILATLQENDAADQKEKISGEAIEALHEELSEGLSALAIEKAQREVDFNDAVSRADDAKESGQFGFWQRFGRVLASKRLGKDIGLLKKPLSYALTALLLISLVGWSAEPMANSLRLSINNLRVNAEKVDVQRQLDEAMSVASQIKADKEVSNVGDATSVQSATRLLARGAVDALTSRPLLGKAMVTENMADARAEFVRAAIGGNEMSASGRSDDVTKLRAEVAKQVAQGTSAPIEKGAVIAHVENDLKPIVEKLHHEQPGLFQKLATSLEARYANTMSPIDAQGKLIEKIIDSAVGGLNTGQSSELGKQAEKIAVDAGKKAISTAVDNFARSYVADMILDAARPEVARGVRQVVSLEYSKKTHEFVRELVEVHTDNWIPAKAVAEEERMSRAVAEAVARRGGNDPFLQAAVRERLSGYDNLFPGPAVGGNGGKGAIGGAQGTAFARARATNFHLASRSFRVRGVLIGREHPSVGLTVNDIKWTPPTRQGSSTRTSISIKAGDAWRDIGTFDAGVLNQALRYGADRRVVATTITPGDGEVIGRATYLHPALVDTPLGCRVVESDRFIDTFSSTLKAGEASSSFRQLVEDRRQTGRWLETLKLADLVVRKVGVNQCPIKEIEEIVKARQLGNVRFSPSLNHAMTRFVETEKASKRGSTAFLERATVCSTKTTESVALCLCDLTKGGALSSTTERYWLPVDHTSQFREREEKLTPDMAWLQRSKDNLGHVDLWVHTTLALHSWSDDGEADEAFTAAINFPEDELASLRSVVRARIPGYLKTELNTASVDGFMGPLEDFILLQRLVRAGLDGRLGPAFPMQKLILLERETRAYVPMQPTIRWEGREGIQKVLSDADAKAGETYSRWKSDSEARRSLRRPLCDPASK